MPDLDLIKQGEQASARAASGRSLKPPPIEDAVKAVGFLAGRPEDIVEQLKAVEKRYPGLDRVISATPLDVQLEDLDRFANEVIPALRDTRTAAAAQ
jgi:alkanesulfonate monooxygenase SsuD/methylene tetrahydromethanopterin reductase-like flavin-dependent oxidoreductase (luciferase family)